MDRERKAHKDCFARTKNAECPWQWMRPRRDRCGECRSCRAHNKKRAELEEASHRNQGLNYGY